MSPKCESGGNPRQIMNMMNCFRLFRFQDPPLPADYIVKLSNSPRPKAHPYLRFRLQNPFKYKHEHFYSSTTLLTRQYDRASSHRTMHLNLDLTAPRSSMSLDSKKSRSSEP